MGLEDHPVSFLQSGKISLILALLPFPNLDKPIRLT
jgi:hypothetical protein